jgi:hypothetical protein
MLREQDVPRQMLADSALVLRAALVAHPPPRRAAARRLPARSLGHMCAHGCRRLLIYCSAGLYCHHSATVDADG